MTCKCIDCSALIFIMKNLLNIIIRMYTAEYVRTIDYAITNSTRYHLVKYTDLWRAPLFTNNTHLRWINQFKNRGEGYAPLAAFDRGRWRREETLMISAMRPSMDAAMTCPSASRTRRRPIAIWSMKTSSGKCTWSSGFVRRTSNAEHTGKSHSHIVHTLYNNGNTIYIYGAYVPYST